MQYFIFLFQYLEIVMRQNRTEVVAVVIVTVLKKIEMVSGYNHDHYLNIIIFNTTKIISGAKISISFKTHLH